MVKKNVFSIAFLDGSSNCFNIAAERPENNVERSGRHVSTVRASDHDGQRRINELKHIYLNQAL